jgi:Cu(I)/Ag(I) efflux system membrane protein CusA/SilA
VTRAIREGNQEVGANVIEMGGTQFTVRARGYVKNLEDIMKIPVAVLEKGRVITVGDIGRVQKVSAPRVGAGELDGEGEAVGGIVIMRIGENALNVIERVKMRMESLKASLPPGVEIVETYDRSILIVIMSNPF